MAIATGTHNIEWRWQGIKSCCWLTCLEMLMQAKYDNIYGRGRTDHTATAKRECMKNKGSLLKYHAREYGLVTNATLVSSSDLQDWTTALEQGPVLAEGLFGAGKIGWGRHVILIVGVSRTGNLAYYNPNVFSFVTSKLDRVSYMTLARCRQLTTNDGIAGPFWQVSEDVAATGQESLRVVDY